MSSSGEEPGLGPLPPHIADRFYRSKNSRRKSSAPSSRRSSLSSHHSSRSALSAHGGPRSSHIAQHLRRASILETRKARLADRAAHAEQVRLRAAIAKAAPRITLNSEERALAAKQARERYLAQVAANCAEEVRRAKKIAEDTNKKKAADHLRMKGEMEERLAEAERRRIVRQQNQRRPRNANLPTVEEKKVSKTVWIPRNEEEAAVFIQRAWRRYQRRQAFTEFLQLGLTLENIQNTGFDEVGALISQPRVLASTGKVLQHCGLSDIEDNGTVEKNAVRTFLSAFLVLGKPKHVLSGAGVQEQDLVEKAKVLLVEFDRVLTQPPLSCGVPSEQSARLCEAYSSFQTAFTAWKNHDSSTLIEGMIAQFVELDGIWQTLKDDTSPEVTSDYKNGIQQNQTLILVGLKKLLGPTKAMEMIKDALKKSRKSTPKRKIRTGSKPRAALYTNDVSAPSSSMKQELIQGGNPAMPTPTQSDLSHSSNQARPSILPDNRTIMHELAMNNEYRVDPEPSVEKRNDMIHSITVDLRQALESSEGQLCIVAMAGKIRDKLLGLVAPGKSFHKMISEALDPHEVLRQVRVGSFSYQGFFSFMTGILPELCAPVRDADVKSFVEDMTEDPIERLAKLAYVVDLLLLDHANFTMQFHAPDLIKEADVYELSCFSERLNGQPPVKTSRVWAQAKTRLREENARRGLTGPPKAEKIYMHVIVDLAVGLEPLQEVDVPETLELDLERFNRLRSEFLRMIIVASVLLTAKNLLKRDVRSQWKTEAQRMWELPFGDFQPFVSVIESGHAMPPTTKAQLCGTIERVLGDARNRQATHPVVKVLLQKLKSHMFSRLSAASSEERMRNLNSTGNVLSSSGLIEFAGQIGTIVAELKKVADVDRAAHSQWYEEVAAAATDEAP